jgi:DNA-binding NarL/FixJ family response regulator
MDTRRRRCEPQGARARSALERPRGGPLRNAASSGAIVLIVEDHQTLRASMHDWLESLVPGVVVLSVASVEEALATLAHASADVVLMDIGLPGVDGIEGTRLIRARGPQTAVVVLSILDDRAHVVQAMDAGAVAFVAKRRMRSELPGVLRAALVRQAEAKAAGPPAELL